MTPCVLERFILAITNIFTGFFVFLCSAPAMDKQAGRIKNAASAIGTKTSPKTFFIVSARDSSLIARKVRELEHLGYPYVIVCGDKTDLPNVVHRPPTGKYDAMNFGLQFVPPDIDVVAFNDVDTQIHNLEAALRAIKNDTVSLVFARVEVAEGPQLTFYMILDPLRRRVPIAASGELMLIKKKDLMEIMPLRPCKAEDTYILFRFLGAGKRAIFSQECYVTTNRTMKDKEEEDYKRRTVGGIYQALAMTRAPLGVRFFYSLLPLASPLLLIMRRKGFYWMKGIVSGFVDYTRGDRSATWKPIGKS